MGVGLGWGGRWLHGPGRIGAFRWDLSLAQAKCYFSRARGALFSARLTSTTKWSCPSRIQTDNNGVGRSDSQSASGMPQDQTTAEVVPRATEKRPAKQIMQKPSAQLNPATPAAPLDLNRDRQGYRAK